MIVYYNSVLEFFGLAEDVHNKLVSLQKAAECVLLQEPHEKERDREKRQGKACRSVFESKLHGISRADLKECIQLHRS